MRKSTLLLGLITTIAFSCQEKNILVIKPGIGLDNLEFLSSDTTEIKSYKGISFTKETGTSVADGHSETCYENWTEYSNDNLGITFTFSTPCLKNADTSKQMFVSISLNKTPNACLTENVCIGSTLEEVIKLKGEPEEKYEQISGQTFVHYPNLQMTFSNDTLNQIINYSAKKINNPIQ